jgi:multicomponent Na+:H+ antiporter subunit F
VTDPWLLAAALVLVGLLLCGFVAMRGSPIERLIGLELGAVLTALALMLLAEGFDRDVYFDLALVFTALSFAGNLAYIRFFERWI